MDGRGEPLLKQPGQDQLYVPVKDVDRGSKRLPGNVSTDHVD